MRSKSLLGNKSTNKEVALFVLTAQITKSDFILIHNVEMKINETAGCPEQYERNLHITWKENETGHQKAEGPALPRLIA